MLIQRSAALLACVQQWTPKQGTRARVTSCRTTSPTDWVAAQHWTSVWSSSSEGCGRQRGEQHDQVFIWAAANGHTIYRVRRGTSFRFYILPGVLSTGSVDRTA